MLRDAIDADRLRYATIATLSYRHYDAATLRHATISPPAATRHYLLRHMIWQRHITTPLPCRRFRLLSVLMRHAVVVMSVHICCCCYVYALEPPRFRCC